METVVTELARYFLVIIMAFYTFWGFMIFTSSRKKREKLCKKQRKAMYLFYILSNLVVYLNTEDEMILMLCGCGMILFCLSGLIYQRVYLKDNMPIFNHMQMFFAISLVMLARLNPDTAKKQLCYIVVAMVCCLLIPVILEHYSKLDKDGVFYAVLGIILLAVVLFFGTEKYGAKNWINLGPVALQPSEFSKICFVIGFAGLLSIEKLTFKNVMRLSVFAAGYVMILVLEKDLGGALIFFVCYLFMLFVATGQASYLLLGTAAGSLAATIAYRLFSHVRTRVLAWKDPWSNIDNQGYQVAQSLFAIGTGGLFGMGLTQGMPNTVPIRESDFIFAAISEELGAFFALFMIMNYVGCFISFIRIAAKVKSMFQKLVVLGFSVIIMFQTFLTLGGVIKFIPSTGVTLPLVSAGGSSVISMIVMFCMIGAINVLSSKEVSGQYEQTAEETE